MINASASVSSASSANNTTEDEIKLVEEGIDYDKTPKPLIFLRLSTLLLFISLIILAAIQFSINGNKDNENLQYQKILFRTA